MCGACSKSWGAPPCFSVTLQGRWSGGGKIWTTWCCPSAPGIAFDWAAADCQWSLSSHTVLLKAFIYCLECQGFVIAVSTDAWHWGLKNDGWWCFMHKLSLLQAEQQPWNNKYLECNPTVVYLKQLRWADTNVSCNTEPVLWLMVSLPQRKWNVSWLLWIHLSYPSCKEAIKRVHKGETYFEGDWIYPLSITFKLTN